MSIGYKINVNDTFHFDMDQESVSQLDAVSVGPNDFHILQEKTPFKASIIASDFNQKNRNYRKIFCYAGGRKVYVYC